jgi:hypothetical protein
MGFDPASGGLAHTDTIHLNSGDNIRWKITHTDAGTITIGATPHTFMSIMQV